MPGHERLAEGSFSGTVLWGTTFLTEGGAEALAGARSAAYHGPELHISRLISRKSIEAGRRQQWQDWAETDITRDMADVIQLSEIKSKLSQLKGRVDALRGYL